MKLIHKEDVETKRWSGGTTSEIAIYPEGSVYADRDFIWRLSSAVIEDEESTFTALDDYQRFLTLREGELELRHDDGDWYAIRPGDVAGFDGGRKTESRGRVTDFNLMLRKGAAKGHMVAANLKAGTGFKADSDAMADAAGKDATIMTAVFLSSGANLRMEKDDELVVMISAGETIIFESEAELKGLTGRVTDDSLVIISKIIIEDKND